MATNAPVEFVLIGFEGDQFSSELVPALIELVDSGTVRILDLVFVRKHADGSVTSFEYDDLPELSAYGEINGESDGLWSESDILDAAEVLDPGTAAALIIWEDLWAARFGAAVRASGGRLITGGRFAQDEIEAALAALDAEGDN
jgi:Family of unknown function (DUF6325)